MEQKLLYYCIKNCYLDPACIIVINIVPISPIYFALLYAESRLILQFVIVTDYTVKV